MLYTKIVDGSLIVLVEPSAGFTPFDFDVDPFVFITTLSEQQHFIVEWNSSSLRPTLGYEEWNIRSSLESRRVMFDIDITRSMV